MSVVIGSESRPLRVAIIGSGPSGFYAAESLLKNSEIISEVDMFEYLPTPYGLVRAGVAPDHQQIKSVSKVYDKIASMDRFRFWGNVQFGNDITREELLDTFDAIIYAIGAQSDRAMGIDGETKIGSHSATEFVAWYNGHPDYKETLFDLSHERAVIVGMGNVALDIARVLALTPEEIAKTDIPHHVQEQLSSSNIKEICLVARRGPLQAAFTNTGTKEIPELEGAVAVVDPEELKLENNTAEILKDSNDKKMIQNLQFLESISENQPDPSKRTIRFLFRRSPQEILGGDHVTGLSFVVNELFTDDEGKIHQTMTEDLETLDCGLVFRSVGYKVKPIDGIQFDAKRGTIANVEGRVIHAETSETQRGEYVVGWAKRGASGVIGTNKPDSIATVDKLLEDLPSWTGEPLVRSQAETVKTLLDSKEIHYVPFEDWKIIEKAEHEEGAVREKPREKFVTVHDMISVIKAEKLG